MHAIVIGAMVLQHEFQSVVTWRLPCHLVGGSRMLYLYFRLLDCTTAAGRINAPLLCPQCCSADRSRHGGLSGIAANTAAVVNLHIACSSMIGTSIRI